MFVSKLINQGNAPVLEQLLQFSADRHKLLSENIANVDTPGYRQKDLSLQKFQHAMRERISRRASAPVGSVTFDDLTPDVESPDRGILFHDNNNRSMEHLMSDFAKNAMMHNMAVELLRKQFAGLELALKERIS